MFGVGAVVEAKQSCDQKIEAELKLKCQESRGSGLSRKGLTALGRAAALPLTFAALGELTYFNPTF